MKKTLLLIFILLLILSLAGCSSSTPRDGSKEYPYLVQGAGDLQNIGNGSWESNDHYTLESDVSINGEIDKYFPAGDTNNPFNGVIDGNGHTIYINGNINLDEESDYGGLLGYIGENGVVKNITIRGGNLFGGKKYTGLIAGVNEGKISNIRYGNRKKYGDTTGSAKVVGNKNDRATVGTLVGWNKEDGEITRTMVVVGETQGYYSKEQENSGGTGGLVGINEGLIRECFSAHTVKGEVNVGGLVGLNNDGIIKDSYTHKPVDVENAETPENIGLFVGKSMAGEIIRSYTGGGIGDGSDSYLNASSDDIEFIGTFAGKIEDTTIEDCIRIPNKQDYDNVDYEENTYRIIGSEEETNEEKVSLFPGQEMNNEKIIEKFEEVFGEDKYNEIWTLNTEHQDFPLLQWELNQLENE